MSPLRPGDPGEGHGEDGDDGTDDPVEFRPPLPPEDRIWRHPSEVAAARRDLVPEPGGRRAPRALGLATLSALIGALLALGGAAAVGWFDPDTRLVERQVAVQPVTTGVHEVDTVAAIATRTAPAIMALRTERDGETAAGSALAYRSDGHLLTSAQLVAGASSIEVLLHDGSAATARVLGVDTLTDVAVLRLAATDLDPAALGSAAGLEVGDRTIAIGSAGEGGWSPAIVTGVVSSLGQRFEGDDGLVLHDVIFVDAPVPDGAAGGPLLDASGAVVGLTSASPIGTAFGVATPIDVVRHVADQLIAHGRARHVWLGVEGSDLASGEAVTMGIAGGAAVNRVMDGSPAAAVGLERGDVIVAIGELPIESMSDLIAVLRMHEPGDQVDLTVWRGGTQVPATVTLAEKT